MWQKYLQIAVTNYRTTYHETLGCKPCTVFHGRIPYNVLDLNLGIKSKWKTTPNSDIAEQLQKQFDEVRATVKDNIMLSYLQYKNTMTVKRLQPCLEKMTTVIFLIRKSKFSQQNLEFKIATGRDRI